VVVVLVVVVVMLYCACVDRTGRDAGRRSVAERDLRRTCGVLVARSRPLAQSMDPGIPASCTAGRPAVQEAGMPGSMDWASGRERATRTPQVRRKSRSATDRRPASRPVRSTHAQYNITTTTTSTTTTSSSSSSSSGGGGD